MKNLSDIKKIAVLGAGVMGPGIAHAYAMGGYEVSIYDNSKDAVEKAKVVLRRNLEIFKLEEVLSEAESQDVFERVHFSNDVEQTLRNANFIQETITENKDIKAKFFNSIDSLIQDDAILASNTSYLNIFEIVPKHRLKQTVIAHWYGPPQIIPLVDVVKAEEAPEEVAHLTMELLKKCGKITVYMKKFVPGYIVNVFQRYLMDAVFYLLDNEYCTPEEIDTAVKSSLMPRGVVNGICQRTDFAGVDITASRYKENEMPPTLAKLVAAGHLGVKSGKGFFDYTGLDREALNAKRDRQLFESFRLAKKFMDDPLIGK
jgi:3-hydroxyacyl-CoA dehydrogenase